MDNKDAPSTEPIPIDLESLVKQRVLEETASQTRKMQEMEKLLKESIKSLEENKKYTQQLQLLHEKKTVKEKNNLLETSISEKIKKIKNKDKKLMNTNKKKKGISSPAKVQKTKNSNHSQPRQKNTENSNTDTNENMDTEKKNMTGDDWEIMPMATKESKEYKAKGTNKRSRIKKIINIRKRYGEDPELLTMWTCGSLEWHTFNNVWLDKRMSIKKFNKKYKLQLLSNYIDAKIANGEDEGTESEDNESEDNESEDSDTIK